MYLHMYQKVRHWCPYQSHENHVIRPLSLILPSTDSTSDVLQQIERAGSVGSE